MIGLCLAINIILRVLKAQPEIGQTFNMSHLWPMSLFFFKRPDWQDVITLVGIFGLWVGFIKLWKGRAQLKYLIIVGTLLIIGTNLLQGFEDGFISPIVGYNKYSVHYYHDTPRIQTIGHFFETYTLFQHNLLDHSRVHPPGALLSFFVLRKIWDEPIFLSLILMISGVTSCFFVYDYLRNKISKENAKAITIIFLLIPAIQIFFLATLDALICSLFIASLWSWDKSRGIDKWFFITALIVWFSFFMTFAAVILVPVLVVEDYRRSKNVKLVLKLGLLLGAMYFGLYYLTNFNYLECFFVAKSYEGRGGFYFFSAPIEYISTRLQDVILILVYFGPYLSLLLIKAIKRIDWRELPLAVTPMTAIIIFLGFLIMGAYYTGETSRAAMFMYPFMMIIIGLYFGKKKLSFTDKVFLFSSTFVQTVFWQLFGFHSF